MRSLEDFLDYDLEEDVIDVIVYLLDGSLLKSPDYSDYNVIEVNYEQKDDGKYCTIIVDFNHFKPSKLIN